MAVCPECHEPIKQGSHRCPSCGYRVDSSNIALPASVQED